MRTKELMSRLETCIPSMTQDHAEETRYLMQRSYCGEILTKSQMGFLLGMHGIYFASVERSISTIEPHIDRFKIRTRSRFLAIVNQWGRGSGPIKATDLSWLKGLAVNCKGRRSSSF